MDALLIEHAATLQRQKQDGVLGLSLKNPRVDGVKARELRISALARAVLAAVKTYREKIQCRVSAGEMQRLKELVVELIKADAELDYDYWGMSQLYVYFEEKRFEIAITNIDN